MLKHLKRAPSGKGIVQRSSDPSKPNEVKGDAAAQATACADEVDTSTRGRGDRTRSPINERMSPSTSTKVLPPLPSSQGKSADKGNVRSNDQPVTSTQQSKGDPVTRKPKARPYIRTDRPSTSASHVHAHASGLPYVHGHENASENWTPPEDAEGAYIRRTYAHFDARGVRGDGLLEGKEWTRERGSRAAWEASDDGVVRNRRLSMPPTTKPFALKGPSVATDPTAIRIQTREGRLSPVPVSESRRPSDGSGKDMKEVKSSSIPATPVEVLESPTDDRAAVKSRLGQVALAASTSSLGTQSEESVKGVTAQDVALNSDDEIDIERKGMMKKIDRYGFFPHEERIKGNSRNRMAILSESSLRNIPKRRLRHLQAPSRQASHAHNGSDPTTGAGNSEASDDEQGQNGSLHLVIEQRNKKEIAVREREAMRARKWDRMLEIRRAADGKPVFVFASGTTRSSKLKQRVYKGVPDRWRAAAWWALLQVRPSTQSASEHEAKFARLQRQPSSHDVQIDLDVPRTISGHILFHTRYGQGQRALFHVLHAFSLLCSDCAYCQGMGPIAATLLVYFTPERAYAAMVELHNDPMSGVHETFSPGFPGLLGNFYAQHKLAHHLCPEVMRSMEAKGVVTSAYATKWYITLFTNVLPFATQLRLWDAYFFQGRDVLVVAAVAILWSLRIELIDGSFERCMGLLGREFVPVDDDLLLNWIYLVMQREDTRKCLTAARKEWSVIVESGKLPVL